MFILFKILFKKFMSKIKKLKWINKCDGSVENWKLKVIKNNWYEEWENQFWQSYEIMEDK